MVLRRGRSLGCAPAENINVCAAMFIHLCLESMPALDAPCASNRAEAEVFEGGQDPDLFVFCPLEREESLFSVWKQLLH